MRYNKKKHWKVGTRMKRFCVLLLTAILLLSLVGCAKAAGGSYFLDYMTADGYRMKPSLFSMSVTLDLEEDGVGTANYNGTVLGITWTDTGRTVIVTGPTKELTFSKDGDKLILHSEGTILYFSPVEEEDED